MKSVLFDGGLVLLRVDHTILEARRDLCALRAQNKDAISGALQIVADRAAQVLRKGASEGKRGPPLTRFTLLKRTIGKEAGKGGPEIPAYGGAKPLYRSGSLASAIDWQKMGPFRFITGIAEGVKGPFAGGHPILPLSWLAALHEESFEVVEPITLHMRGYLRVLFTGGRGTGHSRRSPAGITGATLKVHVPGRHLFHTAWTEVSIAGIEWFREAWYSSRAGQGWF